jgi:membrane protein DedA with SNARE-associated domain
MFELSTGKTIAKPKRTLSKKDKLLTLLVLIILIIILITAFIFRNNIELVNIINRYSLVGILIVSFVACSPVSVTAIPIPYLLMIFTLPSILPEKWGVLAPICVGATAAIGATMGQSITFIIGYGSQNVSESFFLKISENAYNKAIGWIKKYGALAVFAVSAVPNPVHLPVTIALGTAKFSPYRWVFLSLAGNLVKCLIIAFSGYIGLAFILKLLGQ